MSKKWSETEKISVGDLPAVEEEVEEEVTKPHQLPALMRPSSAPVTVSDLRDVFHDLWERMDRIKIVSNRRRRDTDKQINEVSKVPNQVRSLSFKMKIIWWAGTVLLAGTLANLIAGAKYLYGRGGADAEQAITLKMLVEANTDHAKRLRAVEDNSLRLIQKIDDLLNRRGGRLDATTGPSPRGSNP